MTTTTMTGTIGLFEMVLEVANLARSEHFYHQIIGLPIANRWDPNDADGREATFLEIGPHAFLGLWPPETGAKAIANGRGGAHVHFALLVEYGTLTAVRDRLIAQGIQITAELDFAATDWSLVHHVPTCDPPHLPVLSRLEPLVSEGAQLCRNTPTPMSSSANCWGTASAPFSLYPATRSCR